MEPIQQNASTVSNPISTTLAQPRPKNALLIILGILEIPFPLFSLYLLFPLLSLQSTLGVNSFGPFLGLAIFVIAILFAITQIIIGAFSYDEKLGKQKTKALIISGLILAAISLPAFMIFIVGPIYSTVGSLK